MSHIATCGHEVDEGICCSVDNGDFDYVSGAKLVSYGTYCAECLLARDIEDIKNRELKKILRLAKQERDMERHIKSLEAIIEKLVNK